MHIHTEIEIVEWVFLHESLVDFFGPGGGEQKYTANFDCIQTHNTHVIIAIARPLERKSSH